MANRAYRLGSLFIIGLSGFGHEDKIDTTNKHLYNR